MVRLIAIAAIVAVAMFAGCVEEEKASTSIPQQRYVAGDIVGESQSKYYQRIIISYDKDADRYEINTIYRNKDGCWEQSIDSDTRWIRREFIEEIYSTLIDHVDMSTITISEPKISATPAPPPKTVVATPTPTLVLTYQDSEYIEWLVETRSTIQSNYDLIKNALNRRDPESIEIYSGMLYDDAKKALSEIDQIGVSPALKPSKDEFKLALQDYKQVGYYGARGATNVDDVETTIEYVDRAYEHLKRADDILIQNGYTIEKSPKSTTTQASVKSWHPVTTFTGSNDRTTAPFTIRGDRWRVRYTVDGDYDWGLFVAYVYPVGETVMYVSSWDCDGGYCYDTQHIYEGNDDYYFEVLAANIDSWKLEVENFY